MQDDSLWLHPRLAPLFVLFFMAEHETNLMIKTKAVQSNIIRKGRIIQTEYILLVRKKRYHLHSIFCFQNIFHHSEKII